MAEGDRYTVVVRGLVLMSSIGIRRAERDRPQRVRISVELTATPAAAFPGEDRRRVINYEHVIAAIRKIAGLDEINADVFERALRLRAVARYGVGTDRIDLEFKKQFAHARFDPEGQLVAEQLVDERVHVDA